MKLKLSALAFLFAATSSFAATKTYQVTGPVLEVKNDVIVVQKGKEKWEVEKEAATKVSGDLKAGDKVTIEYRMVATNVEVKADKKAEKAKK